MAEKKKSPYTILSYWLNDRSASSEIPEEIKEDKAIGPQYILYYFQSSSYILFLSDLLNNYDIFQMNKIDVFKMMKEIILKTGFKPKYLPMYKNKNTNIYKCLKKKYPFLKKYEMNKLLETVENSFNRDAIYESFGLEKPKKRKSSIQNKKILNDIEPVVNKKEQYKKLNDDEGTWTLDRLLSNFKG